MVDYIDVPSGFDWYSITAVFVRAATQLKDRVYVASPSPNRVHPVCGVGHIVHQQRVVGRHFGHVRRDYPRMKSDVYLLTTPELLGGIR